MPNHQQPSAAARLHQGPRRPRRQYATSTKSRSLRSRAELEQIIAHGQRRQCRCVSERNTAIWVLLAHTGLRPGEAVLLKVGHVCRGGRVADSFILPAQISKTKLDDQEIVLVPRVQAALAAWLEYSGLAEARPDAWLFPPSRHSRSDKPLYFFDRHLRVTSLEKDMRVILADLGLDGHVSPYSLRKYFANTIYAATGNNSLIVKKAMRHRRLSSTEHYIEAEAAAVRNGILQAFADAPLTPPPADPCRQQPRPALAFAAARGLRKVRLVQVQRNAA